MNKEDITTFVTGMAGVHTVKASEGDGSPEAAWGDTFFFYDPKRDLEQNPRLPFATIVTKDYPGHDTASDLNRPGVFRLNISVGRAGFQDVVGYPPAAHADHHAEHDYRAQDTLMPHPLYAVQGWVCVLNPGEATAARARSLIVDAHARAVRQHRPASRKA
ncbi:hypothetical protein SAMN05421505_12641 [Sinosporangium album]|uniref:DUF6194 domain-containing protein n=1 Tax=Sinosporangium album TaxID=504805 RepID=A0A1G8GAD2_9ACTN|nr:DUF6194 family protein [Sinosporangium album]SDH91334.1 hypothetical protein SAMN05421505_12641 [Sinosporangium album]